ncbi:L,D-transpeptidase family protein [Campylobacter canadensis]|uniref:L,D-transpeptidase family protein n=1 Tax=Campylobacter canadensis TaxID=449520 RepID=A0ABS7WQI2_9BACT|nr:L,D-transpeptidase family protein [Campylobacter canadensis]MBZ7986557.1 L,D-transpeptidase family protein [Campylobacter canadensis]MBZ7994038.1 L,D-transpeptidase family protein [Campylobacter canadensis]MBZ7995959.1 L,D-transpeptidase family protein [Campylobacter canadensis]MBZ7997593.1 L,D-transpeptidase family protein [Campylobacter canadensis]MBZ7999369.1 L,D-transpeptidase family protein [Campylobacter canadensis]
MKKIIFFILTINLFATDLTQLYLKEGIKAVEKKLQENITKTDFWKNELKDLDLEYGYYSDDAMIIIVDKTSKNFEVYEEQDNKLKKIFEQIVITGLMGEKKIEGDLKTPIGFYEVLKEINPPEYYGPTAFVLSYPNLLDKAQNKTGSGIWIHGFPLDGDVRYDAYKTKGCVVMTNDVLLDFKELLKNKKAYVLINEKGQSKTNIDEISLLLSNLFKWKNAWTNSDTKEYLSFYSEDFVRFDGMKFAKFKEQKEIIFKRKENKIINFSNISISPYPNIENKKLFRISFSEDYKSDNYSFVGEKTIYVELLNDKFLILTEQ